MPLLTFSVDIEGVKREMGVLVDALEDLDTPLLRTGGRLRAKAKNRIRSQEFTPLAPATIKRKMNEGMLALLEKTGKSGRSIFDRVLAEQRKIGRAESGAVEVGPQTRKTTKALARVESSRELLAAIQRHVGERAGLLSVRALVAAADRERRRRLIHGAALRAARDLEKGPERERVARIGRRRYQAKATSTMILGGFIDQMHLRLEGSAVVMVIRGPSKVHNDGGTAGHGATIPKREMARIDPDDVAFFETALREHVASKRG